MSIILYHHLYKRRKKVQKSKKHEVEDVLSFCPMKSKLVRCHTKFALAFRLSISFIFLSNENFALPDTQSSLYINLYIYILPEFVYLWIYIYIYHPIWTYLMETEIPKQFQQVTIARFGPTRVEIVLHRVWQQVGSAQLYIGSIEHIPDKPSSIRIRGFVGIFSALMYELDWLLLHGVIYDFVNDKTFQNLMLSIFLVLWYLGPLIDQAKL